MLEARTLFWGKKKHVHELGNHIMLIKQKSNKQLLTRFIFCLVICYKMSWKGKLLHCGI